MPKGNLVTIPRRRIVTVQSPVGGVSYNPKRNKGSRGLGKICANHNLAIGLQRDIGRPDAGSEIRNDASQCRSAQKAHFFALLVEPSLANRNQHCFKTITSLRYSNDKPLLACKTL